MLENDVPLSESLKLFFQGLQSKSGININRDTVLGHSAFWRGINLVSSTVARLPIDVYKYAKDGGREIDYTHPGHRFINRPNEVTGKFQTLRTLVHHALQHGNGYLWIRRNEFFEPEEGIILDPQLTIPVRTNGNLSYITRASTSVIVVEPSYELGKLMYLKPYEVLHIHGLSYDGLVGYSVLDVLRDCLGLGLALNRYGSVYFKNMGTPGMVIEFPGKFRDKEEIELFLKGVGDSHEGIDNSFKKMLLQNGAKVSKWQLNNDEAQFNASKEFDLKTVAHVIGIPPHKLGASVNSSYNSLEQENKAFLQDLEPWLHAIEEECCNKLLTETEKQRASRYFEFKREALERADTKTETDTIIAQLNAGILTTNQALALKNMASTGDPSGDKHRMPSNLIFMEDAEELKQAKLQPKVVVATAPNDDDTEPENDPQPEGGGDPGDGDRYARLLNENFTRMLTRLERAYGAKDISPAQLIEDHSEVVRQNLCTVERGKVDLWLESLAQELASVTKDQIATVFKRQRGTQWI